MRLAFRIRIKRGDKVLLKADLEPSKDPLMVAIRYVLEHKYLEATKWLHIAEDSYEKYLLLYLIAKALKQEDLEKEYYALWEGKKKLTDLEFSIEYPQVS